MHALRHRRLNLTSSWIVFTPAPKRCGRRWRRPSDETVVVEDWEGEVAPAPLRLGLVHLGCTRSRTAPGRGPGRGPAGRAAMAAPSALELLAERGVDPPSPSMPRGRPARRPPRRGLVSIGVASPRRAMPRRPESPLVPDPTGFVERRDDDVGQVRRGVPQRSARRGGDRDLAAHHQDLQHLRDVAVVRPSCRGSTALDARIRDVA